MQLVESHEDHADTADMRRAIEAYTAFIGGLQKIAGCGGDAAGAVMTAVKSHMNTINSQQRKGRGNTELQRRIDLYNRKVLPPTS